MQKVLGVLLSLALLGSAPPVRAELCAIDAVPAATLLLPYFSVDLSKLTKPKRTETTTIIVQNIDSDPRIARVTLWSDLSVPTVAFDLYIAGFGTREVALHDLFRGRFPDSSAFLDPGCAPWGLVDKSDLQNAHRGGPVAGFGDRCSSTRGDAKFARGYVTIDNINTDSQCSSLFPSDSGYFASGGTGIASNENYLFGWVNNDNRKVKYGEIEPLVHIEAGSSGSGYTFYGRYVGYSGADGREPLGTTWTFSYAVSGGARTYLEVWRDSGTVQGPFDCGQLGVEGWYPLDETQVVAFDAEGNFTVKCENNPSDSVFCFPAEAGSYRFDTGRLAVPYGRGWTFLNLNTGQGAHQSYVSVRQTLGSGKRRGRSQAVNPNSACGQAPPSSGVPIP